MEDKEIFFVLEKFKKQEISCYSAIFLQVSIIIVHLKKK